MTVTVAYDDEEGTVTYLTEEDRLLYERVKRETGASIREITGSKYRKR